MKKSEIDLTDLTVDELFAFHRDASADTASSAEIARRLRAMSDAELEAAERDRFGDWNTGGALETEKATRASRRKQQIAESIAASTRERYRAMSKVQLEGEHESLRIKAMSLKGRAQHDVLERMKICGEELAAKKRDEIRAEPPTFVSTSLWFLRTLPTRPVLAGGALLVVIVSALVSLAWAIIKLVR